MSDMLEPSSTRIPCAKAAGRSVRENAQAKGRRYLSDSRLRVVFVKPGDPRIRATCKGDGMTYRLGFDPSRSWWCECPAKTPDCAHLIGLRLVAEPELGGPL